jgi:ABC-type multidrug transport system fused ATPase/permease subunit
MGILLAILSKNIIDFVIGNDIEKFTYTAIIYAIVTFLLLGIRSFLHYYKTRFTLNLTNHLQENFYSSYFTHEWSEMYKYHSGDIVTRITKDISSIVSFFSTVFPSVIALLIQLTIAFTVAVNYDKVLGIFGFATLPIIMIISLIFGEKMKIQQRIINEKEGEYRSFINESVQNVLIVKTFQNESSKLSKLINLQNDKLSVILRKTKITVLSSATIDFGYTLSSVIAFIWGTYRISQGYISFGTFTAIMQLISRMQSPIIQLSRLLPQYISSTAAVERCVPFEKIHSLSNSDIINRNNQIGINISNMSFSYDGENKVIDNITINIKPGEKVAIIGPSGVGKTTLLKIIMNLYKPLSGNINLYDNRYIYENIIDYYSYIPQGNTLFSGTIRSNLLLGNVDATDYDLRKALDNACALDFVDKLPRRLDSVLEEKGQGLSEGQIQRICIARSLLRDTPILLLDESTSSLDQNTEEAVIKKIYKNYPHKTVVAITHRPTLLKYVDNIIELN